MSIVFTSILVGCDTSFANTSYIHAMYVYSETSYNGPSELRPTLNTNGPSDTKVSLVYIYLLEGLKHSVAGDHVTSDIPESQLHHCSHISLAHQLQSLQHSRKRWQRRSRGCKWVSDLPTFGSWTNAPPLVLGGWSPVVTYFRHSIIVCGYNYSNTYHTSKNRHANFCCERFACS